MEYKNITSKISETNYKILRFILIVFIAYVVGYVFGQVYSHYTHK